MLKEMVWNKYLQKEGLDQYPEIVKLFDFKEAEYENNGKKNGFTHNFDGNTGLRRIGCRIPLDATCLFLLTFSFFGCLI